MSLSHHVAQVTPATISIIYAIQNRTHNPIPMRDQFLALREFSRASLTRPAFQHESTLEAYIIPRIPNGTQHRMVTMMARAIYVDGFSSSYLVSWLTYPLAGTSVMEHPQFVQNFASSGSSVPQFLQNIPGAFRKEETSCRCPRISRRRPRLWTQA